MRTVSTVEYIPHWSICSNDRFSRVGGVTRVQLASHPDIILLLDADEARGHPSDVVQRVRHRLYAAGSDPSEGLS
jgi:hypothetical protein